jgi:phosphomannomutase/phosphoglucomutase
VQAPIDNRAAIILGCSGVIVLMIGLLLRRRTRLARYLGSNEAASTESEAPPRSAAPRAAPNKRAGGRRATKTMVLGGQEANEQAKTPPEQEEPPTVMAPAPDLPEWLRDDVDSGLDELGGDEGTLESTQPVPGGVFPGPEDDADDELLEEFEAYQGVDPSLFRPDGIYGEAGKELAVPDMVIFGQAIGSEALHQGLRRVCIAHDGRPSGPELLEGLAQGLSVCGIDVIDLGATPAPIAWFAAHRMQQAGAVVVTGGNRPEAINGLEIVFDGLWLGREERRTLLDRIRNQEFATGAGERTTGDEAETYRNQLTADHRLQRPLRVVVDCGNAVNGAVAQPLFESLEVDIIPLNADAETRADQVAAFDSPQRQQDLKLCVENFAADLGLAFDRAAGRLRVVGPDGRDPAAGRLAALLATDLPESGEANPTVLVDETLFEQVAGVDGVEVVPFAGGVHELQQKLREREATMATAPDGTVCVARNWHGMPDALYAGAWLLAVLAADETSVAEKLATDDGESQGGQASARATGADRKV